MCIRAEALRIRTFASRTYRFLGFLLSDRTRSGFSVASDLGRPRHSAAGVSGWIF